MREHSRLWFSLPLWSSFIATATASLAPCLSGLPSDPAVAIDSALGEEHFGYRPTQKGTTQSTNLNGPLGGRYMGYHLVREKKTRSKSPLGLHGLACLRGGSVSTGEVPGAIQKKRRKKRKKAKRGKGEKEKTKKEKSEIVKTEENRKVAEKTAKKEEIEEVLKEKDAAQMLGDAIRDRADVLRKESPMLEGIRVSVRSVGWAMGASDHRLLIKDDLSRKKSGFSFEQNVEDDEGGGVDAAPTSVVVHYFLKSHGGAHALQCLCSILSAIAGIGALSLTGNGQLRLTLMKRCMLFAMVKHVSGLLAASFLTARAIPDVGLRRARIWIEQLAADPVSQYVFYTACTLFWLPSGPPPTPAWWENYSVVPILLVSPVLIREIVSTALVVSDVLVLWTCSSTDKGVKSLVRYVLVVSQSFVNVTMSLLVTSKVWGSSNASRRQEILAKLASRFSLAMEVMVGLLFLADAAWGVVQFSFASSTHRPQLLELIRRLICARLYTHFLWTRRRNIHRLVTQIRGGAAHASFGLLMDPESLTEA